MAKQFLIPVALIILLSAGLTGCSTTQDTSSPIGMAVEFNTHAACAYIAQEQDLFKKAGLNITAYESYVTGTALAAALARGDIQVAYICLPPAINTYANAGVPVKIVSGTHKYGFGLAVNPDKIKNVRDLEREGIRIGCVQTGSATDVLLQKLIDKYGLDRVKVTKNIQQMNPPKQVMAVAGGKLDAVFIPEQWATMAEKNGFKMLLTAKDVWPDLIGSVLLVKKELLDKDPDSVRKLVEITGQTTKFIEQNRDEAVQIITRELQTTSVTVLPVEVVDTVKQLEITPEVISSSMDRLEYSEEINPVMVQETIDYMASLGYIKNKFKAEDILDLRFVK